MKYKIHFTNIKDLDNSVVITGPTIESIQKKTMEFLKTHQNPNVRLNTCWSEEIKE